MYYTNQVVGYLSNQWLVTVIHYTWDVSTHFSAHFHI